jgi:hypothetical protein
MKPLLRFFTIFLLITSYGVVAIGQQLAVNTTKIEILIRQWNDLHNTRNLAVFENLYDDDVLYYTERIPRTKATLLKKLFFVRNPGYEQRIASDIKYTFHTNGILLCEFTKEVSKGSDWEAHPMYLLVGYKKHGYWILGESDYETDQRLGYVLNIGQPENIEIIPASMHSRKIAPAIVTPSVDNLSMIRGFFQYVNPMYIILGLLGTAVFLIVRDQLEQKMTRRAMATSNEPAMLDDGPEVQEAAPESVIDTTTGKLPHQVYQMIEYYLKQNSFKQFLLKSFDPLSFTHPNLQEHVLPIGPDAGDFVNPRIDFQYHDRNNPPLNFSVQCVYREDNGDVIQLLPPELFKNVEGNDLTTSAYYIIGIGGPPICPDDLYLVPSSEVTSDSISKEFLKSFRKSGMFYVSSSGRLM